MAYPYGYPAVSKAYVDSKVPYKVLGETGYTTLAEAITTIGATSTRLFIPDNTTVTLTADTTLAATTRVAIGTGVQFVASATGALVGTASVTETAGANNITSVGTAVTLLAGTWPAELVEGCWITADSKRAQVFKIDSTTTLTLYSAFSADVTNKAYTFNSTTLTGDSSAWSSALSVGDLLKIGSEYFSVMAIAGDTSLTLDHCPEAAVPLATTITRGFRLSLLGGMDAPHDQTKIFSGYLGSIWFEPSQEVSCVWFAKQGTGLTNDMWAGNSSIAMGGVGEAMMQCPQTTIFHVPVGKYNAYRSIRISRDGISLLGKRGQYRAETDNRTYQSEIAMTAGGNTNIFLLKNPTGVGLSAPRIENITLVKSGAYIVHGFKCGDVTGGTGLAIFKGIESQGLSTGATFWTRGRDLMVFEDLVMRSKYGWLVSPNTNGVTTIDLDGVVVTGTIYYEGPTGAGDALMYIEDGVDLITNIEFTGHTGVANCQYGIYYVTTSGSTSHGNLSFNNFKFEGYTGAGSCFNLSPNKDLVNVIIRNCSNATLSNFLTGKNLQNVHIDTCMHYPAGGGSMLDLSAGSNFNISGTNINVNPVSWEANDLGGMAVVKMVHGDRAEGQEYAAEWTLHSLKTLATITKTGPLSLDHDWVGVGEYATAGENLVIGNICYLKSDGKWWIAFSDVADTRMPGLRMATGTIAADAVGIFLKNGDIRDDSWAWTAPNQLYVSATGTVTATPPAVSGNVVQIIGRAKSGDVISFEPSPVQIEVP